MLRRVPGILPAVGLSILMALPASLEAQQPQEHTVVISVDLANGTISYSTDPVVAFRGDRIVFSSPNAESWTVRFDEGTPFANREIGGDGSQSRTVPVLPTAAFRSYKYAVTVTVGGRTFTQDPEIIIRDRGMR